jgi:hypothetical protein
MGKADHGQKQVGFTHAEPATPDNQGKLAHAGTFGKGLQETDGQKPTSGLVLKLGEQVSGGYGLMMALHRLARVAPI